MGHDRPGLQPVSGIEVATPAARAWPLIALSYALTFANLVEVDLYGMGSEQYRNRVRVTGAVENPVSLPYRQGMTVLDLVLEAGGVTEFANPRKARLYRESGENVALHLDRILNRGDMSTNYPLRKGDTITIPERAF